MSAVPAMTSAVPAVTAQDLELEHAELLPARETLMVNPIRFYPVPVHHPCPVPVRPYPGPVRPYPGPVYPYPGHAHPGVNDA
jgi:hypothetical protein